MMNLQGNRGENVLVRSLQYQVPKGGLGSAGGGGILGPASQEALAEG